MKAKKHFKHSAGAMFDPRMQHLYHKEGVRGYGIYWRLLEFACSNPSHSFSFADLPTLAGTIGTRSMVLKRIIGDYGLFVIRKDKIHPRELMEDTSEKDPENTPENTPSHRVGTPCNSLAVSDKEKSSHAGAPNSVVVDDIIFLKENNNNIKKKERVISCLVNSLAADRQWLEQLWITHGLRPEHLVHLPQVFTLFTTHIQSYGKARQLPHLQAVRQYFANFLDADTRTGKRLRGLLEVWQREAPPGVGGAVPVSPFEVLHNGKRTYMGGLPIPDDAPPRPSPTACWDECACGWVC